jgi:hypothetical protein
MFEGGSELVDDLAAKDREAQVRRLEIADLREIPARLRIDVESGEEFIAFASTASPHLLFEGIEVFASPVDLLPGPGE